MAGIDVNRSTTGVPLPKEVSAEIWTNMQEASAVQQRARRINMPGSGITIPIVTGDPEADWVAETDEKPVSTPTFGSKDITPYVLAVIVPFSNQFRRDKAALYRECITRLPGALAKKFDATVFASSGAPGSNFAQLGGSTTVAIGPNATDVKKGTYAGLVAAYQAVADADGALDGWVFNSSGKGLLLNQVDTTGRPLLVDSIANGSNVPLLLGEPVSYSKGVPSASSQVGFAGDWSSAVWGSVEGVSISFSEASITNGTTTLTTSGTDTVDVPNVINLWQRNMFAVRAEIEIGFQVRDSSRFVKLTSTARS
ncbi:phage major capsid protein [Microbacterium terrisoli]|uniref:phage major capsid protein n=1 Tax=Microbacterium terrisoli TaxID=3242192 RepID=UPI002804E55C|nr:phage major capsid protein [Microbacterium protaetiae]